MKPFEVYTTVSSTPMKFDANPSVYGLYMRNNSDSSTSKIPVYRFFAQNGQSVIAEFPADKVVGIVIRNFP